MLVPVSIYVHARNRFDPSIGEGSLTPSTGWEMADRKLLGSLLVRTAALSTLRCVPRLPYVVETQHAQVPYVPYSRRDASSVVASYIRRQRAYGAPRTIMECLSDTESTA